MIIIDDKPTHKAEMVVEHKPSDSHLRELLKMVANIRGDMKYHNVKSVIITEKK